MLPPPPRFVYVHPLLVWATSFVHLCNAYGFFKAQHVFTLNADHKICLEQSRLAISAGRKQSVDTLMLSDKAALLDNPYRHASSGSDVPYDLRKVSTAFTFTISNPPSPIYPCMF